MKGRAQGQAGAWPLLCTGEVNLFGSGMLGAPTRVGTAKLPFIIHN